MFINFENETLQYYTKLEEKSFHLPQLFYFVATFFLYYEPGSSVYGHWSNFQSLNS